jgi:predicted Rossmann-fold nucleotide-binding protein
VTVYGSSSGKTPQRYLKEARNVGYILAKRGHVCVNGAGQYGCMAAMNEGVELGDGSVVGVIHEMFLVDNGYWETTASGTASESSQSSRSQSHSSKRTVIIRDGGAHGVFTNATTRHKDDKVTTIVTPGQRPPIREILVAGGDDLQERKKLLVRGTDALIVLPGGPGTWDELWEMACARHLNLNQLPIVCVNVDGFYEPFRQMLQQAWDDELIKLPPSQIVHFAPNAEDAVRWIETETQQRSDERGNGGGGGRIADAGAGAAPTKSSRRARRTRSTTNRSLLQRTSFFSASPYLTSSSTGRSSFFSWTSSISDGNDSKGAGDDDENDERADDKANLIGVTTILTFFTGFTVGGLVALTYLRSASRSRL